MSNGIGRVWAVNAEGGDEGRPNGVGPVYIENADQLGSKLPEPAAGDAGKVLGVLNSSGDIGWVEDQSGTLTQIQSDWDEDDSSQVSYIQNKPSLAAVATSGSYADLSNKPTIPTVDQVYDSTSANAQSGAAVASAISGKQDTISDLETIRSGAAAGATAVQPSQLATVATSGSYADLSNKPSIPAAQVQSDWNQTNDQAVDFIKNKPTIPAGVVVDQTYSASSTNAQSGTAVAGALSTISQVPASTSADEDKVLTVDSNGDAVWAAAQTGSSYTFSAPLRESSGTVVLDVDTDELKVDVKTTTLSMQTSIEAANNGYALYLGTLPQDTSDTVYTFTFNNVPVPSDVEVAVVAQGKHIYPMLVGETYGSWGNQWIIPTALTLNNNREVTGSFSVCFKPGESDYPTHLDSYGALSWASILVFVVASDVPSAQVAKTSIYGSTTSGSTVSYSTGGSMLMVKHPVPAVTSSDNGKVLKATYSSGVGSFSWDTAPTELPASLGTAGQVLTVNAGGTGVEWSTVQSGTEYTAGDGISISAQDEISVKAGDGLSVGDVTTVLHSFDTPSSKAGGYTVYTICALTSDILEQITSTDGFTFTLSRDFKDATYSGQNIYAGIAVYNASNYGAVTDMALMGSALTTTYDGNNYWLSSGTSITMKWSELVSAYSNLDLTTIQSNISNYCIAIITYGSGSSKFEYARVSASASDDVTATVTDAGVLYVTNPIPSITGNAGKVLSVNSGATGVEWINSVPIEVVASLPASPTNGVLYIVTGS